MAVDGGKLKVGMNKKVTLCAQAIASVCIEN